MEVRSRETAFVLRPEVFSSRWRVSVLRWLPQYVIHFLELRATPCSAYLPNLYKVKIVLWVQLGGDRAENAFNI